MEKRKPELSKTLPLAKPALGLWINGGWAGKTIYSVLDQAVFSGTMLAVNVLLARWTSTEEYGVFAVIFAIFLIVAGIHNALVIEPMTVFGSQKNAERLPRYLSRFYVLHFVLIFLLAAIAALVVNFVSSDSIAYSKWTLAIAIPLVLSFWAARRVCYVTGHPKKAFEMSVIYAVVVVTGLVALNQFLALSAHSAFLLFGIAGFLISLFPIIALYRSVGIPSLKSIRKQRNRHWFYGKWALGDSLMFAIGTSIYPLLIAYFDSVSKAGEFRAIQIVFLPLTHLLTALGLVLLPWLTRARSDADSKGFSRHAYLTVGLFIGLAVAYLLPVQLFGENLVGALYASADYLELAWLIPYLGLTALLTAISMACMIILRSMEKPDLIFLSTAASTAVTLFIGIPLIGLYGPTGLALALVLSTAAGTVMLVWKVYSLLGHSWSMGSGIRANYSAGARR